MESTRRRNQCLCGSDSRSLMVEYVQVRAHGFCLVGSLSTAVNADLLASNQLRTLIYPRQVGYAR